MTPEIKFSLQLAYNPQEELPMFTLEQPSFIATMIKDGEKHRNRPIEVADGITIEMLSPGAFNGTRVEPFGVDIARVLIKSAGKKHGVDYNGYVAFTPEGRQLYSIAMLNPDGSPPETDNPEEKPNHEDLRYGDKYVRRDGALETIYGGTYVPPKHEQPDPKLAYHPAIYRSHLNERGKLEFDPPLVIKEIQGKNATILAATENSAVVMVREDEIDGQPNSHVFSIFNVIGRTVDDYEITKQAEFELPVVEGFNDIKSGTGGSFTQMENGNFLALFHGQSKYDSEGNSQSYIEDDGTIQNKVYYRMVVAEVDTNGTIVHMSRPFINRQLFYSISPASTELRPEEKPEVVYGVDPLVLEGNHYETTVSTADINRIKLKLHTDRIDKELKNGPIHNWQALRLISRDDESDTGLDTAEEELQMIA